MRATIEKYTTLPERLCQLAEEASELSQAALKYRRALTGENPTPVTPDEARENLLEETADVLLCLALCGVNTRARTPDGDEIGRIFRLKLKRWGQRLAAAHGGEKCPKS